MEVLVVVEDPAAYRSAIDAWRRTATVLQELPPWVALAVTGELSERVPDVPGTRWYTGAVPQDMLLRLDPPARIFVAAWLDRRRPRNRPGDGLSWDARGYITPDKPVPDQPGEAR